MKIVGADYVKPFERSKQVRFQNLFWLTELMRVSWLRQKSFLSEKFEILLFQKT